MEQDTEEKEFAKLQARCLKRWKTLILGLRIRQRVNAAYAEAPREGQTNGNNESQVCRIKVMYLPLLKLIDFVLLSLRRKGNVPRPIALHHRRLPHPKRVVHRLVKGR